jgi:peptidyl-prolyl cis-trans isomerase B (cyclophilin B)
MRPILFCSVALLALAACRQEQASASGGGAPAEAAADPGAPAPATSPDAPPAALVAIRRFIEERKIDRSAADWKLRLPKPEAPAFDAAHVWFWQLRTNKGDIEIRLWPESAPMHVTSTVYLTELGFYDGLGFHRVIPGFMAQGGCPVGRGTAGPGYSYDGEFLHPHSHDRRGLLSMANAGPGTDGSQFFILFRSLPQQHRAMLDGKHTIFGEMVSGEPALAAIEVAGTEAGPPRERLVIEKASIRTAPRGG